MASVALERWLGKTGMSQAAFAAPLGISRALLNAYVRGVRIPKLYLAQAIEGATGGEVKVMDWRKPARKTAAKPQ
jgi:DNA-binding transcriptional regulator YdaS (Cro superfamily)